MTVTLYTINDDPKKFPKTLPEQGTDLTGYIRDQSVDLMRPELTVTGSPGAGFNYAYIADFHRYYFVDPPITIRTDLVILPMRCDVLQTYKDQIITAPVIVERSAGKYNTYIADPKRVFYQDRLNQYVTIADLGDPASIVMVTVG